MITTTLKSSSNSPYGFYPALPGVSESAESLSGDVNRSAAQIKNRTCDLGADLVGICRLNRQWLQKDNSLEKHHGTVDFSWVIVIGVAMDAEPFRTSPSPAIRAETINGYSRMKQVAGELGKYIAGLGYNAFSAGNGEALSIPQAIEAGLGQLGRNALLISEQFGSCLRICKVFTDMPLEACKIPQVLTAKICHDCSLCADACPASAIEREHTPPEQGWQINSDRCHEYWKKVDRECAGCISACPATWKNRPS